MDGPKASTATAKAATTSTRRASHPAGGATRPSQRRGSAPAPQNSEATKPPLKKRASQIERATAERARRLQIRADV